MRNAMLSGGGWGTRRPGRGCVVKCNNLSSSVSGAIYRISDQLTGIID